MTCRQFDLAMTIGYGILAKYSLYWGDEEGLAKDKTARIPKTLQEHKITSWNIYVFKGIGMIMERKL